MQNDATGLKNSFNITLQEKERIPQIYSIYWIPKLHKTPYKARFIAGSSSCTTTMLSKLITECLKPVKRHCTAYYKTVLKRTGANNISIINNSLDVIRALEQKRLSLRKVSTWDILTLYTSLPHAKLKINCMIYQKEFLTPAETASSPSITFTLSGQMIGSLRSTPSSLARNFALPQTF